MRISQRTCSRVVAIAIIDSLHCFKRKQLKIQMALSYGKLTIGLLGVEDPADVRSYSGTPFHLGHFLKDAGHDVRMLGPFPLRYRTLVRLHNRLRRELTRKEVLWERHRLISDQYPAIVSRYADQNPDLDLLLATSVFYIARVRTKVPLLFWADTTVAGLIDRYQRYQHLSKRTIVRSHSVEQDALTACDMAIFSSQWAADLALSTYDLNADKVRVINYGANLLQVPDKREITRLLGLRDPQHVKVLILGFDWKRKGMAKAIQIVGELRRRGMDAQLQIVGCQPPPGFMIPDYVSLFGRVSKYTLEGAKQLQQLLGGSHILILPTEAECAAVVLAEANAYGVPFLSTDVGGNSSLVRQNFNGVLLPLEADVSTWAEAAMSILSDRGTYERFVWQAHDFFDQQLSWKHAVSEFEQASHELLGRNARDDDAAFAIDRISGRCG
jgi:glycosyltransferase involved in cell wall biosynthesis